MDTSSQTIISPALTEQNYNPKNTPNQIISNGKIGTISKIEDICTSNIIYTAEAVAPTGEKMYLALETLGENKIMWDAYKEEINRVCKGFDKDSTTIGSLRDVLLLIDDEKSLDNFLKKNTYPNYWTLDVKRFNKLRINFKKLTPKQEKELCTIPHASRGLNINNQTHMVYASKTPIIRSSDFISNQYNCFGEYVDCYKNIVMSVGVTINDIVENRGIFRNPLSVIKGGYGGISMMLHSFTCMVVKDYYPSIKTFQVHPFGDMARIFLKSLPNDKVTVDGVRADDPNCKKFEGFLERKVQVPISDLANLHRAYPQN